MKFFTLNSVTVCLVFVASHASILRRKNVTVADGHLAVHSNASQGPITFQQWYAAHSAGRGIWKWNDALDAYQNHFAPFAGQQLALVEVGVQSGGSAEMWKGVLGAGLHYYGLDINPNTKSFEDATSTITLGDQADPAMWNNFFTTVVGQVDFIVDDGGHQSHQMLTTFNAGFQKVKPGGYSVIEDVFGEDFIPSLLNPCAESINGWISYVSSVHMYPGMFMVQKAGGWAPAEPVASATFDNMPAFWAAVPSYAGHQLAIKNVNWGNLLQTGNLQSLLKEFSGLYNNAQVWDQPPGCSTTTAAVCTTTIVNSPVQSRVTGIHIFPTQAVVDIAAAVPTISATRKGTEWIDYR